MNESQRQAIALLSEVWSHAPDVRLGQLMAHLGFLGEVHIDKGLGYIEDDELIAIMYRHKAELLARIQGTANPPAPTSNADISVSGSSTVQLPAPASDL